MIGKIASEEGGNYLVFQAINRYLKTIAGVGNGSYIYYWQSKGLSDERINSITASNYSVTPFLDYYGTKTRVEFSGSCLKQDKVTFNHGKIVNIYIVYEISKSINISDYLTLENCLFGAVSLTKNAEIDRCGYSGYGIGFDRHGSFSFPGTGLGRNVIIFGVDMSSSTTIHNRKKDIFILGKGPMQGLEHTLSTGKMYSINLTEHNKRFCLSLHYNGAKVYLFVNSKQIHKSREKDSEIVATPLCIGNGSKDWTVDNMEMTGLNGYVYDFRVDYNVIKNPTIFMTYIHKYLMVKNDIV